MPELILGLIEPDSLPRMGEGAPRPTEFARDWEERAAAAADYWERLRESIRSDEDWEAEDLADAAYDLLAEWKFGQRLDEGLRSAETLDRLDRLIGHDAERLVKLVSGVPDPAGWSQAVGAWLDDLEDPNWDPLDLARGARELTEDLDRADLVRVAAESLSPGAGRQLEDELRTCSDVLADQAEFFALAGPFVRCLVEAADPNLEARDLTLALTLYKLCPVLEALVDQHTEATAPEPELDPAESEMWSHVARQLLGEPRESLATKIFNVVFDTLSRGSRSPRWQWELGSPSLTTGALAALSSSTPPSEPTDSLGKPRLRLTLTLRRSGDELIATLRPSRDWTGTAELVHRQTPASDARTVAVWDSSGGDKRIGLAANMMTDADGQPAPSGEFELRIASTDEKAE